MESGAAAFFLISLVVGVGSDFINADAVSAEPRLAYTPVGASVLATFIIFFALTALIVLLTNTLNKVERTREEERQRDQFLLTKTTTNVDERNALLESTNDVHKTGGRAHVKRNSRGNLPATGVEMTSTSRSGDAEIENILNARGNRLTENIKAITKERTPREVGESSQEGH